MSKYVVNTDEVRNAIAELKELKSDCDEYASKKVPSSKQCKGNTKNAVVNTMKEIQEGFVNLSELIEATIKFLDGQSKTVDTNDANSAKSISP